MIRALLLHKAWILQEIWAQAIRCSSEQVRQIRELALALALAAYAARMGRSPLPPLDAVAPFPQAIAGGQPVGLPTPVVAVLVKGIAG